ncbi:MAG: sigma-70 family RNA polymerase sigma factor [Tissierellia bacterium]|nr:sigma-70 family RNA polymerase sigma factor [Tissierellia bacterium]
MFGELLEKAKNGDKASTEEIINRLQPLIISSIRRYYNKPNEYHDLIQDGILKVLECIKDYEPSKGVHFLGYVKIMLRYLYLDKHKMKVHQSLNEVVGDGEVELMDLLVSEDKEPLEEILDREDKKYLLEALNRLTDRQRQVVILYYFEKMRLEDIASMLGVSYRTVVNTKTRAIEKLTLGLYFDE